MTRGARAGAAAAATAAAVAVTAHGHRCRHFLRSAFKKRTMALSDTLPSLQIGGFRCRQTEGQKQDGADDLMSA